MAPIQERANQFALSIFHILTLRISAGVALWAHAVADPDLLRCNFHLGIRLIFGLVTHWAKF